MYKRPRFKSDIIKKLQGLGFNRDTLSFYSDGSFKMIRASNGGASILISSDHERFCYLGPEGIATHESEELEAEAWYKQLLQAIYLPVIESGMLVAYDPGYKVELGKVKRLSKDGSKAFVWYHGGDTAACTLIEDLYPIERDFVLQHRDMFENAYAIDDILAKEIQDDD